MLNEQFNEQMGNQGNRCNPVLTTIPIVTFTNNIAITKGTNMILLFTVATKVINK